MDDSFDAPRQSLLDVVQEKLQKQGKTVVYSRLVYIASLEGKVNHKDEIQVRCGGTAMSLDALYMRRVASLFALHRVLTCFDDGTTFLVEYDYRCLRKAFC
eukprot:980849-Prorocentrum_minimum.AAC.2